MTLWEVEIDNAYAVELRMHQIADYFSLLLPLASLGWRGPAALSTLPSSAFSLKKKTSLPEHVNGVNGLMD